MANRIDQALIELSKLPPEEALVAIEALENKRRQEQYVKYWVPQDEQFDAVKKFTPEIKTLVVRGGNRSGKTDAGAAVITTAALGKDYFRGEPAWEWVQFLPFRAPPINIWIVGLDFSAIRDVIWGEKLRYGKSHPSFIPKSEILKTSESEFWVQFQNGSRITCKSADSGWEKFQGASVDIVWFDEECDVTVYDECYQRTVDCDGKILVTLTPLTDISSGVKTPWVFDLYEKMMAGQKNIAFADLSTLKSKFISDNEKEELIKKWSGHPEEDARLYGKFLRRSGLVYYMFNPSLHIVSTAPIPHSDFRIVVIDPAPTGPSAALAGAADRFGNITLYQEYKEANLVASEHAKNILAAFTSEGPIDLWLMDPKGGSQRSIDTHKTAADLYRAAGIPVRLAKLPEDYGLASSLEYMQATITPNARHPKVFVQDHLIKFRHEVGSYVWDRFARGDKKGLSKEAPRKGNDDLLNCFQYMSCYHPRARNFIQPSDLDRRKMAELNSYT